ncbi:hypothetical protein L0337_20115 [candidate division KSB1 bacterium]|nr:hypothetical protein [candidate division KSB1 bacterium]
MGNMLSRLQTAANLQNGKGDSAKAAYSARKKSSDTKSRLDKFYGLFIALLAVANTVFIGGDLRAGTISEGPPFYADVLYFRDGDGENTLTKVWVEVPYSSYVFLKTDIGHEARAEIAVIFEDSGGFQIGGNTAADTICTDDLETALANDRTRLFYFGFRVTPGRYNVRIVISNAYSDRRRSTTIKLNVPSFRQPQPQISSLQMARYVETSEQVAMPQKRGLSILPNIAHIFSGEKPICLLYFEAYNVASISAPEDSFQVWCRLSRLGREVRSFTTKHSAASPKALVDVKLDLTGLAPGEYMLTAEVLDRNGKRQAGGVTMLSLTHPNVISSRMPGDMLE